MARRTVVTLIDDLDGGTADETVNFTIDGKRLTIDLSTANAEALRRILRPYLEAGRRSTRRRPPRRTARATSTARADPVSPRAVRAWATAHDIPVNPRGQVPAQLVAQFREAGN